MTYRDLLLDPNWQAKRQKIINRDGCKCTVCNNFNLLQNSLAGLMFFHGENYHGKLFGFYGYNKKGILIDHKVFVKKDLNISAISSPKGHVVYIDEAPGNEIFAKMIAIRERELTDYEELVLKHPDEIASQSTYQSQSEAWQNYKWIMAPSLLVHNSYYKKNLSPWDYPDSSLQTICSVCLEQLNKKQGVPYLNENDTPIRILTPCKKCFGTGYFPGCQDNEVTICDRCDGAMYEEFFYKAHAL
jgi:hypothetical protein